MQDFLLFLP